MDSQRDISSSSRNRRMCRSKCQERRTLDFGSNGLPVQQKILFTSGDYWLVNYSDIKMNPQVSDDTLETQTPKGVQIEHPAILVPFGTAVAGYAS